MKKKNLNPYRGAATSPDPSASPQPSAPHVLGKLGAPVGLKGEVRLILPPSEAAVVDRVLAEAPQLWLKSSSESTWRATRLRLVRAAKGTPVVAFEGIADRTALESLVSPVELAIESADLKDYLDEDEYLTEELIGCAVEDADGEAVGRVVDIQEGPQDLLCIDPEPAWWKARGNAADERKVFRLPMAESLILEIALPARTIVAELPQGIESL